MINSYRSTSRHNISINNTWLILLLISLLPSKILVFAQKDDLVCEPWCEKNLTPWFAYPGTSMKCNWSRCSGCTPCLNMGCKSYCANDSIPWNTGNGRKKCEWDACKGCPPCTGDTEYTATDRYKPIPSPGGSSKTNAPTSEEYSSQCPKQCRLSNDPWIDSPEVNQKCNTETCLGCPECQQPLCAPVCASENVPWKARFARKQKCGWANCHGCPQCTGNGLYEPKPTPPAVAPKRAPTRLPTTLPTRRRTSAPKKAKSQPVPPVGAPKTSDNGGECKITCYTANRDVPWVARFARKQKCNWPSCYGCATCRGPTTPPPILLPVTAPPTVTISNRPSLQASTLPTTSSKPSMLSFPTISPKPTVSHKPTLSVSPTTSPTTSPTLSSAPSSTPSVHPTTSLYPSRTPTVYPTVSPSLTPTLSLKPTFPPTRSPTSSKKPSTQPSVTPTTTLHPTVAPTRKPTISAKPTTETPKPTREATNNPSSTPSASKTPTNLPSNLPTDSTSPTNAGHSGSGAYRCPEPGDDNTLIIPSTSDIISIYSSSYGTICLLTTPITSKSQTYYQPVARSYDSHQWENVAGPYVSQTPLSCHTDEDNFDTVCHITLPPKLSSSSGDQSPVIHLTTYESLHSHITNRHILSRFLTQATFGPNVSLLNNFIPDVDYLSYSDLEWSFANYIETQYDTPMTLHREYYRERATIRLKTTSTHGIPSHPCDEGSRWIRFAFVPEDRGLAVDVSGGGPYVLSIGGVPRVEVDNLDVRDGNPLTSPGTYEICEAVEGVGESFVLFIDGKCSELLSGNPPVGFATHYPETVFFVEEGRKGEFEEWEGLIPDGLIHVGEMTDAQCGGINAGSDGGAFPSYVVFSDGDWLLFDPRLVLHKNTLEETMEHGGGKNVPYGALCANAHRSFLNADKCYYDPSQHACGVDEVNNGVICGSQGEIPNNPIRGDSYGFDIDKNLKIVLQETKWSSWFMITLYSEDQLRQRMAWALSQLLAVAPGQIPRSWASEAFLNFYDIFVKHAFGNYRDVLKEVSYSMIMAQMLSYLNSRSTDHNFKRHDGLLTYPDENYAREIMQLFTIGIVKLHLNGTAITDENGYDIPVYDNKDIMTFSRAWTGFAKVSMRGNIETVENWNRIDPMKIEPTWRDMFPKKNLYDGYIGDGYPLCRDLASGGFLRIGAKFRLLGTSPHAQWTVDQWDAYDTPKYVTLDASGSSSLYNILCAAENESSGCTYPGEVVLTSNLQCHSVECAIDTLRTVRLGTSDIYYEYLREPCVEFAFYDAMKVTTFKQQNGMCADPALPLAGEACCEPGNTQASRNCRYISERVTFDTATSRCEELGMAPCDFNRVGDRKTNDCNVMGFYWEFLWTDKPCDILIKVNAEEDGDIAIIHSLDGFEDEQITIHVQQNTPNYFPVHWNGGQYPSPSNGCANGACEDTGDDRCICLTVVTESVLWENVGEVPLTVEEVQQKAFIGSYSPETIGMNAYEPAFSLPGSDATIWIHLRADTRVFDENTIFEIEHHGITHYLKNLQSTVYIKSLVDGSTRNYSFRNTPHFVNLIDQYERDGHYETDAVLDHYFHHPNTAPFLATRFIQRFGISNPSPRYVEVVARAFLMGLYEWNDGEISFGTGEYGDLYAMVAAILLDREARSLALDRDPFHGSLKEPLLKVILFMRAMEYKNFAHVPEIPIQDVETRIDQMAHLLPNVFSFFLPEYSPPGVIRFAGLVSPESQICVTPYVIGLMNSLFSLSKWGLTKCYSGLGPVTEGSCRLPEGNHTKSAGSLTYVPAEGQRSGMLGGVEVVDELDLLLTGGRLNDVSRGIIAKAFDEAENEEQGLRTAQQLIVTTAEFNSLGDMIVMGDDADAGNAGPPPGAPPPPDDADRYKAIVFILLDGGMDSFNLLVPHSDCAVDLIPKDMFQEYKDVRGSVSLAKERLLTIDASKNAQVCTTFGIHEDLPLLKQLYDEGDLTFLSNVGVLVEPVNKINYKEKTKTKLFAHNHQKRYIQQIDPFHEVAGTGILGRMTDSLVQRGYNPGLISVGGESDSLVGEAGISPTIKFVNGIGIDPFNLKPSMKDMEEVMRSLNKRNTTLMSGIFGKTWNLKFQDSLTANKEVNDAMSESRTSITFPPAYLGDKLSLVARMIKAHKTLNTNRDVYYVRFNGFDSHADVFTTLYEKFTELNDALSSFVNEMKHQQRWNDVTVLGLSEFGRTLTPNSGDGTDHGWAGNYFMAGGSVDGGRILGQYPNDLTESSPLNVGRGRLIPTTSWDQVWNGVAEWFGVHAEDMDKVLPNRDKFSNLFGREDLYVDD